MISYARRSNILSESVDLMRRLFVGIILSLLITIPAQAAPWWWAHFTDGVLASNSQTARWYAFGVNQAVDATDTVYVCSYTWSSGATPIASINGINGANTAGLNAVSAAGGKPSYLIADGDGGAGLTNAQTLSDADVTDVTEAAGGAIMHIKDFYVANKGWTISSGNHTSAGWGSQYNNFLYFRAAQFPSMEQKVASKMYEMSQGTFHSTTPYGTTNFFSPNGDTVELRYAPNDNDGTIGPNANSIHGRLRQLIQGAKESIFYMSDAWSSGTRTAAVANDILNNNSVTIAGAGGAGTDWDADTQASFEANHTHRNEAGASNKLHSKTFIFDMEVVATGSSNMTAAATNTVGSNDEAHVIVHDFRLARRYMQHYHQIMAAATADPSADAYDATAPAGATGLGITATDTAFYATWTASATADVARYYLFIDTAALTQAAIGDRLDGDADGYFDEDPRGDYDGFASGTTTADDTPNDDDADGSADEDLWMAPEVMVKGRASTSGVIRTWNVGDTLQAGVNYYFGIVSVDTQGNEGTIATAGPFQLGASIDTRIIISKNSDTASANAVRGETNVVVGSIFIKGDTTTSGDTLSVFAVRNNGSADTADVTVKLWRDENRDSRITLGVDTLVATLTRYNPSTKQFDSTILADSRSYLGSGTGAGRNFLVSIDVAAAAGIGDTFQLQIAAQTCDAVRWDTGPTTGFTNSGIFTIISANQVTVEKRGDTPSGNIAKNDTRVVMTLRISVSQSVDTLLAAGIKNLGSMVGSDVARLAIYEDAGADSLLTSADTFIKNLTNSGSIWRDTTLSYNFPGTSVNLLVVLVTSSGAGGSKTFQGEIPIREFDTTKGDSGPLSAFSTSAVFTVPSDTSPDTAVVINEFIASPNTLDHDNDADVSDGDEEYVELYNNSDGNVDVGGWKLDDDQTPGDVVLPAGITLGARQFLVVYDSQPTVAQRWFRYDSTGVTVLESGSFTGSGFALNTTTDTIWLANASNVKIDTREYFTETGDSSGSRVFDGAETWVNSAPVSPGKNSDPLAKFNISSPNAKFVVTASPTTVDEGDSFTITATLRNRNGQALTEFYRTATIRSDSGTIGPTTTGNFAAGVRSESISISNVAASGIRTVTVAYNSTTSGTVAVTVNNLATVTAYVDLEARADESFCTGTLSNGVDTYIAVSNASGTIVFNAVSSGTYRLETKENHHLKRVLTSVSVTGTDTTVTVGLHRAGDVNTDNRVNIFDAAIVKFRKIFGTGVQADIDGDGDVDSADVGWIRTNFGRVGEE